MIFFPKKQNLETYDDHTFPNSQIALFSIENETYNRIDKPNLPPENAFPPPNSRFKPRLFVK